MVKELIDGEIYYEKITSYTYISKFKKSQYKQSHINISTSVFRTFGVSVELKNVIRIASPQEKAWLNACIKANKFIPMDEVNYNVIHEIW